MNNGLILIIALPIALVLVLVIAYALFVALRRSNRTPDDIRYSGAVSQAAIDEGERVSSLVSEQIETMTRQKLAAYDDLSGVALDFGTVTDGTIDIWVDGVQYDDPEDIPDSRIREAIKSAVAEFNV